MPRKAKRGTKEDDGWTPRGHLIRITDTAARRKAIMLLGEVPHSYCGFPGYQWLVLNTHLEVLKKAGIPYEVLS
jgi:hypothetical protein